MPVTVPVGTSFADLIVLPILNIYHLSELPRTPDDVVPALDVVRCHGHHGAGWELRPEACPPPPSDGAHRFLSTSPHPQIRPVSLVLD